MGGEWRESATDEWYPITNSSTGEVMAEAPRCTADEVNGAVAAAAAAFPAWRDTPLPERVQVMFRFKERLEANLHDLAVLTATEMGKSYVEARGDVLKVIEVVELACALPVTMQGDSLMNVSRGFDTVTYREPLGVFVGIAPWNFPAHDPDGLDDAAGGHHRQHLRAQGGLVRCRRPRCASPSCSTTPACPPACSTWSPAPATRPSSC